MTRDVVTARAETPLRDVVRLLAERAVSGLPVVDERGRVLGVVSEADVLTCGNGIRRRLRLRSLLARRGREDLRRRIEAGTAGRAMTAPALVVRPSDSVAAAARLMESRRVNRLPVVDGDGRLVGIIARSDVVRAFARPDAEVELEIRGLLGCVLSVPAEDVQVRVRSGEAALSGRIESPDLEELVVALAEEVPGVLSVETACTYERPRPERPWPHGRLFAGVG